MKFVGLLLALVLSTPAFAGFQGINGATNLGVFNKVTCSTGLSCTKVGDQFKIVSSPSISTGSLSITGANDTDDAYIEMKADRGDDNADFWKLSSVAATNSLIAYSKTSGSYVAKWTLTTAGNMTLAGTSTVTGTTTMTGGMVVAAGVRTNWGRALTSLTGGTSTTPSATTVYLTQIWVEANSSITGIKVNSAATVGTNKYIVALFDSTGTPVANSALAGVTTANANAYQTIAFTTPYAAVGPGVYWIALYVNGTTDRFFSLPAASEGGGKAGTVTAQTFGTVAAVTLPTTFTADVGPVAFTY